MKYERYGGILKEKHGLYDKSKHKKWCPMLLSNDFHGVFAYRGQQDQQQKKGQDMNESIIRDYQQDDDTRGHLLQVRYKWQ